MGLGRGNRGHRWDCWEDPESSFDPWPLRPLPPDYFVDHMGDYEDVLASLETLNHSVLKAMGYTKKVSELGAPWGSKASKAGLVPGFLQSFLN